MKFKMLGPPELWASESRPIRLSPQLWVILASLLMSEGKPVTVDSLSDHLWGWNPPPMATANIRTHVSRMNTLLAEGGIRVIGRAGGYQLPLDPQDVDLHTFRSLRRQAESVAESGELDFAADLLSQADELWRGPALMGLSGEWASARRQALDEERHEAVKLRIGIELDRGRQGSIIGEIRELAERHPFDEEVARALMISLYRLGRLKDAIEVGREVGERFADVGMEPGPQFRDVHIRILRGDAGLGVTPAYRGSDRVGQPNTLPPEAPDFVGRAEEVSMLIADCRSNVPVLGIVEGMAGVGKSALAIRVAHHMAARYPDAQLFLSFPGDGPGGVAEALHRLLRMLGVPAARIPAEIGERARVWRAELAHRRAVIVLDDVPGPDEVAPIMPTAGDSLTIVTLRQRANWPGHSVLRLEPLTLGDSVMLLRRSSGPAAGQDAGKAAAVADLCGGLPLAIRVAAGRLREGGLDDLDSLIGELTEVHAGRADDTEAGRRIFSAFESTYRQLSERNKRIFRLLGISPCADFGLDAAAALAGEDKDGVAEGIRVLSGRYLLERSSAGRFRFHDLIRSYAAARCAKEEPEYEYGRAINRLTRHYLDTLNAAIAVNHGPSVNGARDSVGADDGDPPGRFPNADSAHAWLEEEWRNILLMAGHASRRERHRQCADLTHSLDGFLHTEGHWNYAVSAHELALRTCRLLSDPALVARAALDLSAACRCTGEYEKARRHAEEALAAYTAVGDQRGQAAALDQIGMIHWNTGTARDGLAHHQEARDLYRAAGDQSGMATAVLHVATAFGVLGRSEEEGFNLSEALSMFQKAGDRRGAAMCLNNLGALLHDQGLHRDAVAHYEKSTAIFREIHGGRQNLEILDHNLGRIQQYMGNYDEAIKIYRKALAAYCAIGDLQHQAMALSDIGSAFSDKECYSEALAHHGKSAELAEGIGDKSQLSAALCGMADAYRGSGSYDSAAENYDKAHRLATEIEAPYLSGKALHGMAETVLITQGSRAAKIYWRQALEFFVQLGVPEAKIVELRLHGPDSTAS
jgi:DNA-binding SARP family transcriptional activator/tetratricopeptide (TPR) repeat protein